MMRLSCLALLSSIILVGCRVAQDVSCAAVAINRVSVTSVQYMASVGGVGAETIVVVLRNGSGNGLRVLSQLSKLSVYWIVL